MTADERNRIDALVLAIGDMKVELVDRLNLMDKEWREELDAAIQRHAIGCPLRDVKDEVAPIVRAYEQGRAVRRWWQTTWARVALASGLILGLLSIAERAMGWLH